MKKFLASWIIFQLIIIGVVGGFVSYKLINNTYGCNLYNNETEQFNNILSGIVVPLMFFTTINIDIYRYCDIKNK